MPLSDLFGSLLKPAGKYVLGECQDAGLFVLYAMSLGYDASSDAKALRLVKAAAKWVLEHGTPTREKVKAELGL